MTFINLYNNGYIRSMLLLPDHLYMSFQELILNHQFDYSCLFPRFCVGVDSVNKTIFDAHVNLVFQRIRGQVYRA